MKLLSFRGGVHPPEKKHFSENEPIKKLPLPEKVYMYTSNNLGAPSKPIVAVGDKVKTGQKIAEANGFISANLHSPVTGEIVEITKMINAASGTNDDVIVIQRTGDDDWQLLDGFNKDFTKLSSKEIVNLVKDAGIVGLGGAMFPAHVKMSIPEGKKVEYVIINSSECEPYITIDDRMMIEKGEEVIEGVKIVMQAVGAKKAFIGVEENKKHSLEAIIKATQGDPVEVVLLETKYPQGAEKQLINAIVGKEVPSGGLPLDIGVVVFNLSTCYAIWDAVVNGKPLIERGITLTGEGVKKPGNFWFRIGTKVDELLNYVGLVEEDKIDRILYGGPMMGIALPKTDLSTFKGNNALTVMTKDVAVKREDYHCIRCASCIKACPMGLQPFYLKNLVEKRMYDKAIEEGLMDCIECGSCSFICPSNIDLVKTYKTGKKVIRAMKQRRS